VHVQEKERIMNRFLSLSVVTCLVLAATPTSWAINVNPDDFLAITGTSLAARPELADYSIDYKTFPIVMSGSNGDTVTFDMDVTVVREKVARTLDFYYSLTNTTPSPVEFTLIVSAFGTAQWGPFTTDCDYRTDSLGTFHQNAVWRAPLTETQDVEFYPSYSGPGVYINPNETMLSTFIKTNAYEWDWGGMIGLRAHVQGTPGGYGPWAFSYQVYRPIIHPGDANNDGYVDVVDLGILAKNYDTVGSAVWSMGDFNNDSAVDVVDLGILAKNYDWVAGVPVGTPEPATLSLLAVGAVAMVRRRR
jgi:hypothetical protein